MTLTPEQQKAIEKIQLLLNVKTEHGATESEAAVAASFASKLLLKHNLSLVDLLDETAIEFIDKEELQFITTIKGTWGAQLTLASACAKITGCYTLFKQPRKKLNFAGSVMFIGKKTDRSISIKMFEYLRNTFVAILKEEKKKALSDRRRLYNDSKLGRNWDNKFYEGICDRVAEKISLEFEEVVAQEGAENYMMVKYDEVKAWIAANLRVSVSVVGSKFGKNEAYDQGYSRGNTVNIPQKGQGALSSGIKALK